MKNRLLIYGAKEFGHIVKYLAESCGYSVSGYIDDYATGVPGILGNFSSVRNRYAPEKYSIAVAVGYRDLVARRQVFEKVKTAGYSIPVLIHPNAYVGAHVQIGEGSFVMATGSVDIEASLGPISVIWPGSVVSHNCIVGQNVFLSPNVTLCGYVRIGENTFIGAGAVVVDHVSVPSGSFVKAACLVR